MKKVTPEHNQKSIESRRLRKDFSTSSAKPSSSDNQRSKQVYDHGAIEKKWQEIWEKRNLNRPDLKKANKPFYNLMMYPYPSAEGLHVGNMYAFTGADIYGRFKRMQGFQVFEPIGFDSGGIHSENFAIKMGIHPKKMVEKNIANFTKQLKTIGAMYDWSRTVDVMDPSYYKWTQWIFIQLFKAGLAYKKQAPVTWCPSCKTTVSDEQTEKKAISRQKRINLETGSRKPEAEQNTITICERCKTEVEKRSMEQWFFKITDYAERLLANTEKLNWTEKVLTAQRNWIGKSEGAEIKFKLKTQNSNVKTTSKNSKPKEFQDIEIKVFTTRPDTLFGCTFLCLAPEHPIVAKILGGRMQASSDKIKGISNYVKRAKNKSEIERKAEDKEKTGVFTGFYAINPVNDKKIPVYIADYVLMDYGEGAVMGVPAHDERDFVFAKKYKLPVEPVILKAVDKYRSYLMGSGAIARHDLKKIGVKTIKEKDKETKFVEIKNNWIDDYIKLVKEKIAPGYWNEIVGKDVRFIFKDKKGAVKEYILDEKTHDAINKLAAEYVDEPLGEGSVFSWLAENDFYKDMLIHHEPGILVNSGPWNGWKYPEDIDKVIDWLEKNPPPHQSSERHGGCGRRKTTYKLRDWCISRQRYWGPPIPMVDCPKCGWQAVKESDLPVLLPEINDYLPDGSGKAPLARHPEFYNAKCPKCGGKAKRETDVSDTFLDSSWYFLRYPSAKMQNAKCKMQNYNSCALPWNREITRQWLPVDQYTGGAEHSVLHLMYSRFITMAMHDMGYLSFEEPFPNFYAHGLIIKDGAKMSKSRGNVVNPDDYIEKYGADALRMYLMFIGPFSQGGDFRDTGMKGMYRFIKKVYYLAMRSASQDAQDSPGQKEVQWAMEKTTYEMGRDISRFKYNTAIAKLMEFVNLWQEKIEETGMETAERIAILLTPFAPHMAEEIWQKAKSAKRKVKSFSQKFISVHDQPWPKIDKSSIKEEMATIIVQVNGKKKGELKAQSAKSKAQSEVEKLAKELEKVQKCLKGRMVKKTIFVPGKIVNFVV